MVTAGVKTIFGERLHKRGYLNAYLNRVMVESGCNTQMAERDTCPLHTEHRQPLSKPPFLHTQRDFSPNCTCEIPKIT